MAGCVSGSVLFSCASGCGAIGSSSETAMSVAGVAGTVFAAGVVGGVVPVWGSARVVGVGWFVSFPLGDEVLVVVELSLL